MASGLAQVQRMREHTLLEHHASATGMTCLPPARPGHLLRSGGSGLGRDGAAYPSYRLVCCETTVCRVTDCFALWLVPLVSVVGGSVVGCPIGTSSSSVVLG